MTATFESEDFIFESGEEVEHINDDPDWTERDPAKWHLEGMDAFDYTQYLLAVNIDDLATASLLRQARLRELEKTQPSSSSGGQSGIQDRVYIIHPNQP